MILLKKKLRRLEYENPRIVTAVAQVLLDWAPDTFLAFCDYIRPIASETFSVTEIEVPNVEFGIKVGNEGHTIKPLGGGLSVVLNESNARAVVEATGFRVVLEGAYAGRVFLFEQVHWLCDQLQKFNENLTAVRVSVLYESNIAPPGDSEFMKIEDYVVPRFELDDEDLDLFTEFRHVLAFNLNRIVDGPYRSILRIGTDLQRGGFTISVDVLDDSHTSVDKVSDRLELVKNVETHIFECTITDKTRELYGVLS